MSYKLPDGWEIANEEDVQRKPDPDRPRIVIPNPEEYEKTLLQMHDHRRCGNCEFFLLRQGQDEIRQQQVMPQAMTEYKHNIQWYGNLGQYGLCDQWDGHMTSALAPITIPRHFIDSSASYEEQDSSVECPYYKKRSKGLRSLRHYAGKIRNWEE
jgi:hypothetical protein